MSHFKTVFRTLFYQFLILFAGISIGFISNPEWLGWKSGIIAQSFQNIFFPVKFDSDVCANLKSWGRFKLYVKNNQPKEFEVIEEALLGEEIYVLKYSYVDENNKKQTNIDSIRLRWKPWEYYYELSPIQTDEDIIEYIEKGSINSRESDRARALIYERAELNKEKQK